jgi:hypothetical protein
MSGVLTPTNSLATKLTADRSQAVCESLAEAEGSWRRTLVLQHNQRRSSSRWAGNGALAA